MNRSQTIKKIRRKVKVWDVIIVGGGATGLGIAVDAASRGYKTLLLEQSDFSKGTSSRSTKLVHGGVRYLQQGDIGLVFEALQERGLMFKNAPHLVTNQSFIIPSYEWWGTSFYTVGLKLYDMMAGKLGLGTSKMLSREETIEALPTVQQAGLRGGTIYHDGQFDDARMAISLAFTCVDYGGSVLNYCKVTGLVREKEMVAGVIAVDQISGEEYTIQSKVVVNATGVFVDDIIKMDDPEALETTIPSQGIHLVLDKEFLPNKSAVMVPNTSDGRVMFAVPWHNHIVVGTTDTLVSDRLLEPMALEEEINFLLNTAGLYLTKQPKREDVLSVFAGLRPLAKPQEDGRSTKEISRSHRIIISLTGLITITGGKWTTYRKMAEDVVEKVIVMGGLPDRECVTAHMPIHGFRMDLDPTTDPMAVYGLDKENILALEEDIPELQGFLSEKLQIRKSQVIWAVREEMALTVEDVLARRTRALFLDARESIRMAPEVADLMAKEMNPDDEWKARQIKEFNDIAAGYLIAKNNNDQ